MTRISVHQFSCLQDNYGYLVHVPDTGLTATIDTPDVPAIKAALAETGWRLTHILNTHWHDDHAGGNLALKEEFGATVIAPAGEADRIAGIDRTVVGGDEVDLGGAVSEVIDVPGHTSGHIAYWFAGSDALFSGDALFALGCGRIFEGTFEQMWQSLSRLKVLPDPTLVYCAHEYTAGNAAFAATIEPGNTELMQRIDEIRRLRADGKPTVPSTIGVERRTNPFLRPESREIRAVLAMADDDDVDVFAAIRTRKDMFRG